MQLPPGLAVRRKRLCTLGIGGVPSTPSLCRSLFRGSPILCSSALSAWFPLCRSVRFAGRASGGRGVAVAPPSTDPRAGNELRQPRVLRWCVSLLALLRRALLPCVQTSALGSRKTRPPRRAHRLAWVSGVCRAARLHHALAVMRAVALQTRNPSCLDARGHLARHDVAHGSRARIVWQLPNQPTWR